MTFELAEKYGERLATHTVEIEVRANGVCKFRADEILRNKEIKGVFVKNAAAGAKSPDGRTLVDAGTLNTSYLKLMHNNDQILSNHPVSDLVRYESDHSIRQLNFCRFNPTNSEIYISDAAKVDPSQSFLLTFIYLR